MRAALPSERLTAPAVLQSSLVKAAANTATRAGAAGSGAAGSSADAPVLHGWAHETLQLPTKAATTIGRWRRRESESYPATRNPM